ncbi:MAG: hypothetical protein IJG40_03205 [Oscillospiraceae bacterium]|nr:hypothetical protein [Oscillospiraceae bacterium]
MKKVFSIILAILMLSSISLTGFAEDNSGITVEKVYGWLSAGDDASETPSEQAANGALRLAEMTVVLCSLSIETQDEADHLNNILDKLAEVDLPDESLEHKLAMGFMKTLEGLGIFEQQLDWEGNYQDYFEQIFNSFYANDEKTETAMQQAVNGLYHCVILSSLIAKEHCSTQSMVDQIDQEMADFDAADKATADTNEQLVNGAEFLYRMLTGIASMRDSYGTFADYIQDAANDTYAASEEDPDQMFQLANWLYGCVDMTGILAQELGA